MSGHWLATSRARTAGPRSRADLGLPTVCSSPGRSADATWRALLQPAASPRCRRQTHNAAGRDGTCPGPPGAGAPPLGGGWFVAGDEPQQRLPRPPGQDAQDRAPGDPGDLLDLVDADPGCGGLADDLVPPGLGLGPAAQLVLRI